MVEPGFTDVKYPAGIHMCCIYSDEDETAQNISKFLLKGFEENETVFFSRDNTKPTKVKEYILQSGIDIKKLENSGQLILDKTSNTHYPGGEFKPSNMLDKMKETYTNANKSGYRGSREM